VGELVAQAITAGRDVPSTFRLSRLREIAKRKTQFEK
jgi:hypothetical protein